MKYILYIMVAVGVLLSISDDPTHTSGEEAFASVLWPIYFGQHIGSHLVGHND